MSEQELEELYTELCLALTQVGESRAMLFLARFALLASREVGNPARVRELLAQARAAAECDEPA